MKSAHFTHTVLYEMGYVPRQAIVLTKFLKRDGSLRKNCGPYMVFYPGLEPPLSAIPAILKTLDKLESK